jgi:hypothetical protein
MDYYTERQIDRIINRQTGTKYIGLKEMQKAIQLNWTDGQTNKQMESYLVLLSITQL